VWQVSLKTRFDFGPPDHAKLMGMVGFSYALSQGLVARPLIAFFGKDPTKLILLCISILGGCRPFALKTASVAVVYMLYVPMVIALGVMNTAITTACSFLADGDQLQTLTLPLPLPLTLPLPLPLTLPLPLPLPLPLHPYPYPYP